MAVYLDNSNIEATVQNGDHYVRGKWRHLIADSHEELERAARRAGLRPEWIQHPGTPLEHYDITGSKVKACLDAGAQPVSWRFTGELVAHKRGEERKRERVLVVTGPRKGVSKETVEAGLKRYFRPDVTLIAGGANGVDKDAAELWRSWGGKVEEHRVTQAEWDANPRTAGFNRNDRMIEHAKSAGQARVLAFDLECTTDGCAREKPHNTHGTSHCAESADKAGLKVEHYPVAGELQSESEQPLSDGGTLHPDQPSEKHPYSRGGIQPEGFGVAHKPCPDCGGPTIARPQDEPTTCTACRADAIALEARNAPGGKSMVSRHYPTPEHFPKAPKPGFIGPVRTSAQWEELNRDADKEAGQ